jgi:hypothetical protein
MRGAAGISLLLYHLPPAHFIMHDTIVLDRGLTPNPDVLCNREIKFKRFLEYARGLGADFVATGHYAQLGGTPGEGRRRLLRGRDPHKDQSYFLSLVPAPCFRDVIFPIGGLHKAEVRGWNLPSPITPNANALHADYLIDGCAFCAGAGSGKGGRLAHGRQAGEHGHLLHRQAAVSPSACSRGRPRHSYTLDLRRPIVTREDPARSL